MLNDVARLDGVKLPNIYIYMCIDMLTFADQVCV